jgi:hypothetical protein
MRTPARSAARRADSTTRPQVRERQSFLEDERERQDERLGAAHGEVVHRPVDGELPDVTAGEKIGVTT